MLCLFVISVQTGIHHRQISLFSIVDSNFHMNYEKGNVLNNVAIAIVANLENFMLTQDALVDCRFCSLVSKANGEDPIGTAGTADHWLVVEFAQP